MTAAPVRHLFVVPDKDYKGFVARHKNFIGYVNDRDNCYHFAQVIDNQTYVTNYSLFGYEDILASVKMKPKGYYLTVTKLCQAKKIAKARGYDVSKMFPVDGEPRE